MMSIDSDTSKNPEAHPLKLYQEEKMFIPGLLEELKISDPKKKRLTYIRYFAVGILR